MFPTRRAHFVMLKPVFHYATFVPRSEKRVFILLFRTFQIVEQYFIAKQKNQNTLFASCEKSRRVEIRLCAYKTKKEKFSAYLHTFLKGNFEMTVRGFPGIHTFIMSLLIYKPIVFVLWL